MIPAHCLEDIRWLITPEAGEVIDELAGSPSALPVSVTKRLQRRHSPQRVRLLLDQVELRRRALAKFPEAARMFFLAQTLEQATDIHVARYKARRFPAGQRVADLCCGIGGDSIALAERGPITAVDSDEANVLLAEANIRNLLHQEETDSGHAFLAGDVTHFNVGTCGAWHLDPDRRASGRRTTRIESYAPGLETVERLRIECGEGAVKLAPATQVPESWEQEAELEWIARDRQCRQQVAWFGCLAHTPGQRRATLLRTVPGEPPRVGTIVGAPGDRSPVTDRIGRYVFEPDAAVLAAGLAGALAQQYSLAGLHPDVPYFTADEPLHDPILQCFEVTDVLPFDRKQLRKMFRERRVGHLEIKTRGIVERPEQVRRDLRLRGEAAAVLLLARLGKRVTAIVARRIENEISE